MRQFRSVAVSSCWPHRASPRCCCTRSRSRNPRDVSKLYGELCASCHGPKLTGAQAPSLLDDVWKFGGDDASLTGRSRRAASPRACRRWPTRCRTRKSARWSSSSARKRPSSSAGSRRSPSPPSDTVVKSELHTFKLETVVSGLERRVGHRFPARRAHAADRKGRAAAHRREGQAAARRRSAACPRCGRRGRAVCSTWPCTPTTRPTAGSTCRTATRRPTGPR